MRPRFDVPATMSVQHKAQPAEHLDFPHRTGSGESDAHALGQIFIQSHGPTRNYDQK
jgi:hypothetical protein